jgi:H+-transporting ATPase
MTPLGWGWAAFVGGYALVWFVVNDRVKLVAYWVLDRVKAESKPDTKVRVQPKAKPEPNVEIKAQPDAKPQPPPKAEPVPEISDDVTTLMNTTIGDVLLAGVLKDPEAAGHIVAEAITKAEGTIADAKAPEVAAEPKPKPPITKAKRRPETKAGAKPPAKAKPPSGLPPKTAK